MKGSCVRSSWRAVRCGWLGILAVEILLTTAAAAVAVAATPDVVAHGKYIFGAAGGCGCHTEKTKPGENPKPVNSGGRKYDGPFGTVYSTNITPDRQTGIGTWSDEEIITAIRLGRRPNGERLIPVHPFTIFNGMAEEDLRALVAFLRTVPAVNRSNQPKRIIVPFFESMFLPAWLATFAAQEMPPPKAPTAGLARGEYLVRAVSHCGECHTPRTLTMAPDASRFLAGTQKGPEDSTVPNITPDLETGIGKWSEAEIIEYLSTGNKPDGDTAGGLMDQMINGTVAGIKDLTKADLSAIAQYLKTIPAVRNKIAP